MLHMWHILSQALNRCVGRFQCKVCNADNDNLLINYLTARESLTLILIFMFFFWCNIYVSRKHLSMFGVNLYLNILFFDNERETFVLLSRSVYAATLTCL